MVKNVCSTARSRSIFTTYWNNTKKTSPSQENSYYKHRCESFPLSDNLARRATQFIRGYEKNVVDHQLEEILSFNLVHL
jgi:hypothetical protein